MFFPQSYALAVFLCVITMLCWGSWANTQKMASGTWPFQLYYWDYVFGIVLFSLLAGLTLGSFGEQGRSFLEDLIQGNRDSFTSAFIGGVVFNLANLLIVAAIDIAGMAVAFPVGIGIALILGVLVNYLAKPVGDPLWLFIGVAFVTLAIILDAVAYKNLSATQRKTPVKGILLSILGGILMGFFFRFVAASIAGDFADPESGKFTPYTAVFVFSIGILISNFLWNTIFMIRPLKGERVRFSDYVYKGDSKLHLIGILGGIIWCIGMSFSMIASGKAGFAISYGLGQGATMVAAAWGVFIWREFDEAPKTTGRLITIMFLSFLLGLVLIILARH
jgi:glucose uptake protein